MPVKNDEHMPVLMDGDTPITEITEIWLEDVCTGMDEDFHPEFAPGAVSVNLRAPRHIRRRRHYARFSKRKRIRKKYWAKMGPLELVEVNVLIIKGGHDDLMPITGDIVYYVDDIDQWARRRLKYG